MKCVTLVLLLLTSCEVFGRNIPDNLIDCYTNQTLRERDNRLPATLTTVIDIIRKLESLYSYDVRVLSTALLKTFRVDGITFNPDIQASDGVSPYGIQGFQKEKHALLMKAFFPDNTEEIDVTILTPYEKCALHFMLSDSIEYHKRGSENTDCSNMQAYRRRRTRRDITGAAAANVFASNITMKQLDTSNTSAELQPPQGESVKKDSINEMEFTVPIINVTTLEGNTPLNESEVVSPETKTDTLVLSDQEPSVVVSQVPDVKSSKAEFDESLTYVKEPEVEAKKLVADAKEPAAKSMLSAKLTLGKLTQIETSQCPVENGIIYNKWGSLTLANLIAGIATGIQTMENVKFNDIYPDSANSNTSSLVMDNRWAATLAGDLAEVVIHQGPKTDAIKVGTPGGWNDSVIPHWYFINRAEQTQMTDAEIRGGLDGLIIAKNIATWRSQKPNLRLSHILQQYYSENGVLNTQYKACARREQYAGVTPETEMRAQVEAFAYTLYTSAPLATSMKLEAIKKFSADAISALNSYITSLDTTSCSTTTSTRSETNTSAVAEVDLYVVIDSSWRFSDIQRILVSIADMISLNSIRGSRLSVFTGNSFRPLVNGTMSYVEFYQYFNESFYRSVGDSGFQLRSLLETHLKSLFQNMYNEWKDTTSAGGPSPVVLFVPNGAVSIADTDLNAAQKAVNDFWNNMPDVTFLYMVTSGADRVQSLVVSQDDIITYTIPTTKTETFDLSNLGTSFKKVHKRITNSICSYNQKTQSYSSAEFVDYVQLGYINYYKVNPKYLFGAGSIRIKVQNVQYGTVQVCYSRRVEYPMNNTQSTGSDVTCITGQGGDKEIYISSPCSGYEKILYCPPLYIAVLGQQSTGGECTVKECKDVTDIQMKINHQGLTCGVSQILGNKMLITVVLLVLLRSILSS